MTDDLEMGDAEILAEIQALDDDEIQRLVMLLGELVIPRLEERRPELGGWFQTLEILAQDVQIRRTWSLELLGDEDLVLLKRMGASFRGTSGWDELAGIEPIWVSKEPALVPEAQMELWNTIAAAAAGELDRRQGNTAR